MTDNELTITVNDLMQQIRSYKNQMSTEEILMEYLKISIKLIEVKAQRELLQSNLENMEV